MSKLRCSLYMALISMMQFMPASGAAVSPDLDVTISAETDVASQIRVKGKFNSQDGRRNLSFLLSHAGTEGLGDRISAVQITDSAGNQVNFRKMIPGEYLADRDFVGFEYSVSVSPRQPAGSAAHISWVSKSIGILMLGDLLPMVNGTNGDVSARLRIVLPPEWPVITNEERIGQIDFVTSDVMNAVFYIGRGWRERQIRSGQKPIGLVLSSDWGFSDEEAANMAASLITGYEDIAGARFESSVKIAVAKFPAQTRKGVWEAETRGSSITIISSDMPFRTQSLQRLHEQLRHELFHLWIPNSLSLDGNYDWFFEGFAIYQALKTGVAVNQIRFEDLLSTLGRDYTIIDAQTMYPPLVEASNNRWVGANTQLYARGMLVAFLCDIHLLKSSDGTRSVAEIFRELLKRHSKGMKRMDGNTAIIALLRGRRELTGIVDSYITGKEKISWRYELMWLGVESTTDNFITRLKVSRKLNRPQRELLDRLGYNNWRKLTKNGK
ncbi:MAG: hypothetical protein WBD22_12280 [Pyrinomonadaceae bacterium]